MSQNCRAIALDEYPIELQTKRYIDVYQQSLGIKEVNSESLQKK
jgi:hypothetical protein